MNTVAKEVTPSVQQPTRSDPQSPLHPHAASPWAPGNETPSLGMDVVELNNPDDHHGGASSAGPYSGKDAGMEAGPDLDPQALVMQGSVDGKLREHIPSLSAMLHEVLDVLDDNLNVHRKSFWALNRAIPQLRTIERHTAGYTWMAESTLPGHSMTAVLSVALVPDETKIGVILPATAVFHGDQDLTQKFSEAYGSPPDVMRMMQGGKFMFDRVFRVSPFSSEWMLRSMTDAKALEVLKLRLAYLVDTLWSSTMHVIASAGHFKLYHDLMILSEGAIDGTRLASELPVVVYDFAQHHADSHSTMLRSQLDAHEMRLALERMGIAFQEVVTLKSLEVA